VYADNIIYHDLIFWVIHRTKNILRNKSLHEINILKINYTNGFLWFQGEETVHMIMWLCTLETILQVVA